MPETNFQPCTSSKVCVVEKGKWKKENFNPVCGEMQSGMEPRGGSACQGSGSALGETLALHISQQFLPHCVHPHHVHHRPCSSGSFPFFPSCFFWWNTWEYLEMCVTKSDLFISFHLLLIEQKPVRDGGWCMSKLTLQLLTISWEKAMLSFCDLDIYHSPLKWNLPLGFSGS